ncbi:MAG: arsenate reductase ArsC [Eubacteriales bacterium]
MVKKVLFICVHNSARSQMAEEFLKKLGKGKFEVESAGFEPKKINPYVVEVMKEEGIDLSSKKTQSVFDLVKKQKFYGYVITVCDKSREEECPVFIGTPKRLHWSLKNPEDFTGTDEEILKKVKNLKDQIKELVAEFIRSHEN